MWNRFISYFKRNTYFMVSVIALVLSFMFGVTLFLVFTFGDQTTSTTINHIYVGNVSSGQYRNVINRELQDFYDEASYELSYQNRNLSVVLDYFILDDKTLENVKENQSNPLYLRFDDENNQFRQSIEMTYGESLFLDLDFEALTLQISNDLEKFSYQMTYNLKAFMKDDTQEVLNSYTLVSVDSLLINQILDEIEFFEIKGKNRFSVLEIFKETTLSNEALSVVASGLLNLSLNTPFEGFVYTPHNVKPSYYTLISDVRILRVNQYDLTFYNPLEIDFTVQLEKTSDTSLTFKLEGYELLDTYLTTTTKYKETNQPVIYITNESINETTPGVIITEDDTSITYELLINPGAKGAVYQVTRTINTSGTIQTLVLFNVLEASIPAVYEQNTVLKEVS